MKEETKVRLNKYISEAGLCSRREADRLIREGKVTVDGVKAELGMRILPGQKVTVGEKTLSGAADKVVLAVYKPEGIICTEDRRTKNNIVSFLDYPVRVTYAGRLDKDSEGLLIMTNDGRLIDRMMRARNRHEKEYKVTVDRKITETFLTKLSSGVHITDEEKGLDAVTRPCRAWKEGEYTFRIVLTQGLNRQIRRMCEDCGYTVKRLKRTRIMNIELGNMKPGQVRKLTGEELKCLRSALLADEPYKNRRTDNEQNR